MPQTILRLVSVLFLFALGSSLFAQAYEVSYDVEENKKEKVISIFMRSGADSAIRIRAVNFSIAFDSTCSKVESYDCIFSERWTTFIERSGTIPAKDSLSYDDVVYTSRWIFGTGQMPNTENMILPAITEKPVRILTVTFSKNCKKAPTYPEDEEQFRVNQMGDENNKAVPWVMMREKK